MSIKKLLLLSYIIAGLIISVFTAFMTFYIIDVPIGMKMFSKIVVTIVLTLPVIALLSYIMGSYFSKKFISIKNRLTKIADKDFELYDKNEYIDEIEGIHITLNDVSQQLHKSINTLQEKNRELTWMIRSFAHDFRTPLTIVQGNVEALEDGIIEQNEFSDTFKKIKYETGYMNELLNDMLSFIQSMKSVVKKEKISLKEFVDKEIFVLAQIQKSVSIINNIKEDAVIEFTKTDLKKILMNLIDNSIKFTNRGSVTCMFENNMLIVEDTGIGVDTMECEKIFQPFYTVDVSKNRLQSGFGLGLAIAKNLAQKNDYDIVCDREYERGCRIIVKPILNKELS